MRLKGVCYDVGRVLSGQPWRPVFDPAIVRRELEIIRGDLHCNAIRICGQDIDRLIVAAEDALRQGLEVWLSPELFDHSEHDTLDYIVAAATAAESVRQRWPGKLTLSVGTELFLFMQGILDSQTVLERIGNPLRLSLTMLKLKLLRTHNRPLNAFLKRAVAEVRTVFHGPVTYASAPIEEVDWSLFDYVGLDYYRGKQNRTTYGERLKRHFAHDKPVVITEVGCCTYQGAEDKGARGFMIVDPQHPDRLRSGYVRDEALQAREVADMLDIVDSAGAEGAFVFTFATPTLHYDANPLHDLDMANYALVKSYSGGAHGTTYPDMPWEPKAAFRAVADYYAHH